jgi:hypothetical protein
VEPLLNFELWRSVMRWGRLFQRYLRGTKALTLDLAFDSLKEALGTHYVRAYLPRWVDEGMLCAPGGIAAALKRLRTVVWNEVGKVRRAVAAFEERDRRRREEEERLLEQGDLGARRKQLQKEKAEMAQRLKALGLKADISRITEVEEEDT